MTTTARTPNPLPSGRILGEVTPARRQLLTHVDVIVGYASAVHRHELTGWRIEAALTEPQPGALGSETVALRATPVLGLRVSDPLPLDTDVLRTIAERIVGSLSGVGSVVPDVASLAPDVDGLGFADIDLDVLLSRASWWSDDVQSA